VVILDQYWRVLYSVFKVVSNNYYFHHNRRENEN
jgi:hypothetical protein